jgi:hypothetical protein
VSEILVLILAHCSLFTVHFLPGIMSLRGIFGRKLLGLVPAGIPQWIINEKIRGFGKVLDLKFDPERKFLEGRILLAGEKEPVLVTVDDYEIRKSKDGIVLIVNNLAVDRPWIEILLRKLLIGKEMRIPKDKGGFILDILGI